MFSLLTSEENMQFLQAAAAHDWYPFATCRVTSWDDNSSMHLRIRPPHLSLVQQLAIATSGRHPRL